MKEIDESKYLDPVFLSLGMEVYSNEYAQMLRKENVDLKRKGKRIWNIIPQAGFQEKVLTSRADITVCGGVRGAGKTAVSLIGAFYYADNPDVNLYGFRRFEADVKRGIWKSCKPIFRGFASFADTSYEAKFFGGSGAVMKMEHLADLKQVKDRFRGAEMPYIVIEELAEFTRENLNVIFDLMGSNRSTTGLPSRFICTCNPVGKSNKLRLFLDWWIDPDTDEAIPERSGKIRYFCRYGEDVMEIAWGDTPEEVYDNPNARNKIQSLTDFPDRDYKDYITSLTFIDGDYGENEILHVSDPKYMNRISSGGSRATINDIRGVWRDVDDSDCLVSVDDMIKMFNNSPQTNGRMTASCDVALSRDALVLMAFDGNHLIDAETRVGGRSEDVIPFVESFLSKNGVAKDDFVFDCNGIGGWLRDSEAFRCSVAFDNKGNKQDKNSPMYYDGLRFGNIKSECFSRLVDAIKDEQISIDEALQKKKFRYGKEKLPLRDILMRERLVSRWRDKDGPAEIIQKKDMKDIIGHSPDWWECLIYSRYFLGRRKKMVREGFQFLF